jgi:hypothetical protein
VDKLAARGHLRLFCLTKWMVSYKGQEMWQESFWSSAGDFTRFVLDLVLDCIAASIGCRPARLQQTPTDDRIILETHRTWLTAPDWNTAPDYTSKGLLSLLG